MKDDIIKKALKRSKDKDVADRLQAFADEARDNGVGIHIQMKRHRLSL